MTFSVYYGENIFDTPSVKEYEVGTSIQNVVDDLGYSAGDCSIMFDGDSLDYQPKEGEAVTLQVVPSADGGLTALVVVAIVSGLAVGYLAYRMMPDMNDMGPDDQTKQYRIDGARNEPTPYEPVPIILGKHQVVPDYAAAPYSEFEGDDEWFNMLLCFGAAPLRIRDIKIGDTPLSAYTHQMGLVDWYENNNENEVRELWPDDVAQEVVDADIVHVSDDGGDKSLDWAEEPGKN